MRYMQSAQWEKLNEEWQREARDVAVADLAPFEFKNTFKETQSSPFSTTKHDIKLKLNPDWCGFVGLAIVLQTKSLLGIPVRAMPLGLGAFQRQSVDASLTHNVSLPLLLLPFSSA